jgi:predicted nucleic acid-binding protein
MAKSGFFKKNIKEKKRERKKRALEQKKYVKIKQKIKHSKKMVEQQIDQNFEDLLNKPNVKHEQKEVKTVQLVTEKPERVKSEKVGLDTNVIIDSWHEKHVKEMHQLLKKPGIRIILSETALGEASKKIGIEKKIVLDHLKKRFGERLEIVKTTPEMKEEARKMEEKYDLLHKADSIILAVYKKCNAAVISNDVDLRECCQEEEIEMHDHRLVKTGPTLYERLQKQREREKRNKTPRV